MFQITAVFNKTHLNDVLQDLSERKIPGITINDVAGRGLFAFDSETGDISLDDNIMINIIVPNKDIKEAAKEVIRSNCQDIDTGSGKMWVTQVLEVERIRTGDTNEDALAPHKKFEHALHNDFYTHEDTPSS